MNLDLSIEKTGKTPHGFYFDSGFETGDSCTIYAEEPGEKLEVIFNRRPGNSVYDCYVCTVNMVSVGRPMISEYHFTMFQDLEFNTYHIMNDFENCSDEFPRDNATLMELDCFPQLLKLFFINPPVYTGMMM